MTALKISAVVPARNARPFIADTLEAMRAQTYPLEEIIVVDDGSTDGTAEFVASNYPEVGVITGTRLGGPSAARNRGARAAKGDHLAFCDADDVWLPWKTERQAATLDELRRESGRRPVGLVGGPNTFLVPDEHVRDAWAALCSRSPGGRRGYRETTFRDLFIHYPIMPSTFLVPRDVFWGVGGFDENLTSGGEDLDLCLRVAADHRVIILGEPVFIYRRSAGSMSAVSANNVRALSALLTKWSPANFPKLVSPSLYRKGCTKHLLWLAYTGARGGERPPHEDPAGGAFGFPTERPLESLYGLGLRLSTAMPGIFRLIARSHFSVTTGRRYPT